jgi:hypothetical protein
MKKLWLLLFLVLVPMLCFGYDNLVSPPEDLGQFVTWFFAQAGSVKGQGMTLIIAFGLTALLGVFKYFSTAFKTAFDKLGNWKFIIPIVVGASAELILNLPQPVTLIGVVTTIITGASGIGAVSIAIHHCLDKFIGEKK